MIKHKDWNINYVTLGEGGPLTQGLSQVIAVKYNASRLGEFQDHYFVLPQIEVSQAVLSMMAATKVGCSWAQRGCKQFNPCEHVDQAVMLARRLSLSELLMIRHYTTQTPRKPRLYKPHVASVSFYTRNQHDIKLAENFLLSHPRTGRASPLHIRL